MASNGATATRLGKRSSRSWRRKASQVPPARSNAAPAAIAPHRRRARGGATAAPEVVPPSAARNSSADWKRWAGSLRSAMPNAAASGGGVSGRSASTAFGVAFRWALMTASAESPTKGGVPASIS